MTNKLFKNKKWIKPFIIIFGLITLLLCILYLYIDTSWLKTIAISVFTTYYMSCLRPLVGYFINKKYHNKMNYNRRWFKEKRFEQTLYRVLRVKKWKHILPTFDLDSFNIKSHSLEEIIGVTCQAEVVHDAMLILSLIPLLFIIFWGTAIVFIITSVLFVFIELCFIFVQRYNRARLYKILRKCKYKV